MRPGTRKINILYVVSQMALFPVLAAWPAGEPARREAEARGGE